MEMHQSRCKTTRKSAEKPNPEGGGGFNPRIKPKESMRALAPEQCFSPGGPPSARLCFYAKGGAPKLSIARHEITRSEPLRPLQRSHRVAWQIHLHGLAVEA